MLPTSHFDLLVYQTHICYVTVLRYTKMQTSKIVQRSNLISRNIESKSITLWWSRRKMLARGVCSYVNQSPYFATIDGPPLALKISGKYLTRNRHKLCNIATQRPHYWSWLRITACQFLVCSLTSLLCCDWTTGRGYDSGIVVPEMSQSAQEYVWQKWQTVVHSKNSPVMQKLKALVLSLI